MDRPCLRKHRERETLGDRVRGIIGNGDLVRVGAEMVQRIEDDGRLRRYSDRTEQAVFEIRVRREQRINQQQQPTAAPQIVDQQLRFAQRECRAWSDLGDDGAIRRNSLRRRSDDGAHIESNLVQR